ncbi:uncharacterized protein H6S33_004800 [Morchella sextelata]|uniref:uncharacterized protein n=1 Tax=Morchella sextelata TaxID=1174677 RepID=UPI001D043BC4|nr:uncharacterized protein H6S33_004800 [Morchella sextelata]KAH0605578.1 hypothetical protein H6S33_004800 [Morchella sextelata]
MPAEKYGAILDAGSSGTRIHIYRWDDPEKARKKATKDQLSGLPEITTSKKWAKKIHPGISTFGDHPEDVGPDHLAKLFGHALEHIPKDSIAETPLFLLATAGMRLLPDMQRRRLLDEICTYARRNTEFLLPDCGVHIQVISGETEGLYGWIAANYLLGGFDDPAKHAHGKGHHTYGFLDMGGASAQIAFAPNATEAAKHAEDLTLLRMRTLDGTPMEFGVFVTTWLGFGVNQARIRYVDSLLLASGGNGVTELPDPCLPVGLKLTLDGKEIDPQDMKALEEEHLVGTGKFEECLSQTYPLLAKDGPCSEVSCLLTSKHAPAIDFDINHFVGVSEYWHTTHEIFESDFKTKSYDLSTYQARVKEFCSQDWPHIEDLIEEHKWGKKVDEETAAAVCFKASWLINVLHNGIGIPRVGLEPTGSSRHNITEEVIDAAKDKGFINPFQAVDKIGDVEVSWTLGKMILYASSKVPPKDNTVMAVGFGSNTAPSVNGLPSDFEFASSEAENSPYHLPQPGQAGNSGNTNNSMDSEGDSSHWHDNLWNEGDKVPRRIPGIVLFLLIFCIAGFLLLGRERRGKIWRSIIVSGKNSKRKILGPNGGVIYERVMEEGHDASGAEFELGSVSSSSDEEEIGWKGKSGMYDPPLGSAGVNAIRSGMGSRVGSRERLQVSSRSRNVSPSRSGVPRTRSPLPPRN